VTETARQRWIIQWHRPTPEYFAGPAQLQQPDSGYRWSDDIADAHLFHSPEQALLLLGKWTYWKSNCSVVLCEYVEPAS
jgi:hypothetical protein